MAKDAFRTGKTDGLPALGHKKPPSSGKYTDVHSKVDSGFNEKRLEEQFDLSKLNVRFRRTEDFRRLKPKVFASLFHQDHDTEVDYILLDLREPDAFAHNRIRGAESYPAQTLTRAVNNFTSSVLSFANKEPERIIIVYDNDERTAVPTANLFYEKNVDNVFIITGGLNALALEHQELIEGELPEVEPAKSMSKRRPRSSAAMGKSTSSRTVAAKESIAQRSAARTSQLSESQPSMRSSISSTIGR